MSHRAGRNRRSSRARAAPIRESRGARRGMERVCFLGRVRAERLAEYRERHERVWPEMLDALRQAGWSNYSLFLTGDGLLVGYLETEDFASAQQRMAVTAVNER